uniref:G-protein coupled receptors family 1 profile domain-containing protein n=1 Tax=Romanomermis culicivorax TaxID=13658 RepID=A0A915IDG4_ROMCU
MSDQNETLCQYDPGDHLLERFILIAVFGAFCSLCGVWTNCFLVYIFAFRLNFKDYIFSAWLVGSDCVICFSYLLLFPVQIYSDLFRSYSSYKAWMTYLRPVFAISHISISTSCFMIVAISLDKYWLEVKRRRRRSARKLAGFRAVGIGFRNHVFELIFLS